MSQTIPPHQPASLSPISSIVLFFVIFHSTCMPAQISCILKTNSLPQHHIIPHLLSHLFPALLHKRHLCGQCSSFISQSNSKGLSHGQVNCCKGTTPKSNPPLHLPFPKGNHLKNLLPDCFGTYSVALNNKFLMTYFLLWKLETEHSSFYHMFTHFLPPIHMLRLLRL